MSSSGAVGIDLGSHYCKLAVVRSGGIDAITNDLSNRFTPSIVSFGDKQRFIGESGYSKINANFRNTIAFSPRLLGLTNEYSQLHQETTWLTNKVVTQDNKLAHEVRYLGDTVTFTTERVVAMLITHLKELCQRAGANPSDVVISVPSYWTENERRAFMDALNIADVKPSRIMNETTAAALSYGLFRKKEFTEQPKYVAFADMGHSKFSVAVVQFTKDKLQVLSKAYDRHLGGRDFDKAIIEHFASQFEKKHHVDPLQNTKSRLKLLVAAERMRKILSANPEAQMNVEYLYEDLDLTGTLTRDEFFALTQDLQERIYNTCIEALNKAGIEKVDSVEIVGGASRIPIVQKQIARAFNLEDVSKTMNQEETVARGCAVQAAMLSPLYKVKEFGVVDINTEPILMQTSQLDMEVEEQPETLFNDKNAFPITKLIKFTRNKPFKVDLFYNHLANGLEQTVGKYQINLPQTSDPATVKVAIKMNIHGVVNVESAEKIEVYYETPVVNEEPKEAKTEEAKPEEAKTESEVKPKKKTRKIPLEVQAQVKGIFGDELKQYRAEEKRMSEDDRVARETLEKKNELESFVYDSRDKLNGTYKDFTTQEVISHVFEALRQVEDWLYGDGSDTLKSVYIEKLNSLKEFTDPILKRYSLHTTLPSTLNELYTVVTQGTELANTTHENYSHITTEDRQKVIEKCIEQHNWYSEQLKVLQSTPRHQDIPISTEDLVRRTIQLKEFIASVMNRPKPAPQPKSAPEPQPAKEEKEVPGEGTGESKEEEKMDLD